MTNLLRKKYDMMLATLQKGSKPYYCELEYLESTGTQYIDTGFVPSGNTRVLFDYKPTDGYTGVSCIFGCQTTPAGNNCNRFYYLLSGQTLYRAQFNYTNTATSSQSTPAYWGINYSSSTYSLTTGANGTFASDSSRQTIDIDGYNKTVQFNNGNIIDMSNDATFAKGMSPTYSMFIFDRSLGGISSNTKFKGKIYYFKIWDSGVLVRDFIPVLDWNYVPCLYDKVTDTLFYNIGTGDFIVGREIHEVEYIESTGTEYIDTGLSDYTTFKGTAECTANSSKSQVLIGDSSGGGHFLASRISSTLKWGTSTTTTAAYTNVDTMSKVDFEVNFDNGSTHGYVNNDSFTYSLSASFSTFTIFKNATGNSYPFYGKLFSLKAYKNNTLVRDFIPIVDENFNGYLFDKVNRKIYENAGTGDFVVGKIKEKV